MAERQPRMKTFARAVYDGDVQGPDWPVVNEAGEVIQPGAQSFGESTPGRPVKTEAFSGGATVGHVIDYQHPSDTPLENQDPEVDYGYGQPRNVVSLGRLGTAVSVSSQLL